MADAKASIIVATCNRAGVLKKALEGLSRLDYPDYEIIVVDDSSTDGTQKIIRSFRGIKSYRTPKRSGPAVARNMGLRAARGRYLVIMDDDCIPAKDWLKNLVKPFADPKVGMASSFDTRGGGTSTAFSRKAIEKCGIFDESFPYPYREDTDLVFRLLDKGYTAKKVRADFEHLHQPPGTLEKKIRYGITRIKYHSVDPLLYKKHPKRTKKFLDIKLGFIRNPLMDFRIATGKWEAGREFSLSSPQGVVLIRNRNALYSAAIFTFGLMYVLLVKLARLYGSLKYGKLLV